MKKQAMKTATILSMIIAMASFVGCGGEHAHEGQAEEVQTEVEKHAHVHYACPMDCEEGKTYEAPGQCPVCKMDLVEVDEVAETEVEATHGHEHTYACPMHAEITGHAGDKCSKCGMELEEVPSE